MGTRIQPSERVQKKEQTNQESLVPVNDGVINQIKVGREFYLPFDSEYLRALEKQFNVVIDDTWVEDECPKGQMLYLFATGHSSDLEVLSKFTREVSTCWAMQEDFITSGEICAGMRCNLYLHGCEQEALIVKTSSDHRREYLVYLIEEDIDVWVDKGSITSTWFQEDLPYPKPEHRISRTPSLFLAPTATAILDKNCNQPHQSSHLPHHNGITAVGVITQNASQGSSWPSTQQPPPSTMEEVPIPKPVYLYITQHTDLLTGVREQTGVDASVMETSGSNGVEYLLCLDGTGPMRQQAMQLLKTWIQTQTLNVTPELAPELLFELQDKCDVIVAVEEGQLCLFGAEAALSEARHYIEGLTGQRQPSHPKGKYQVIAGASSSVAVRPSPSVWNGMPRSMDYNKSVGDIVCLPGSDPPCARFFVCKSMFEETIQMSRQQQRWSSTRIGNLFFDDVWAKSQGMDIYLFFSVVSSHSYCGYAKMMSGLYWDQCMQWPKFGAAPFFKVAWLSQQTIDTKAFNGLRNAEGDSIHRCRDRAELPYEVGCQMLDIFCAQERHK